MRRGSEIRKVLKENAPGPFQIKHLFNHNFLYVVYSKSPVQEMNKLLKELENNKDEQLPAFPYNKDFWDKILRGKTRHSELSI